MSIARIVKNDFISRYRVLIIAIAISLFWHLFCLYSVKVVSTPLPKSSVKFSKVAFLGPILSKGIMDLRAAPASRSLLEIKYRNALSSVGDYRAGQDKGTLFASGGLPSAYAHDQEFLNIVDEAVSGEKPEPEYQAD